LQALKTSAEFLYDRAAAEGSKGAAHRRMTGVLRNPEGFS